MNIDKLLENREFEQYLEHIHAKKAFSGEFGQVIGYDIPDMTDEWIGDLSEEEIKAYYKEYSAFSAYDMLNYIYNTNNNNKQ